MATNNLKWPYLLTIAQRGRKFRLQGHVDQIFSDLKVWLDAYVSWGARNNPSRLAKLKEWAEAVFAAGKKNWARKAQDGSLHPEPQGFPGLGQPSGKRTGNLSSCLMTGPHMVLWWQRISRMTKSSGLRYYDLGRRAVSGSRLQSSMGVPQWGRHCVQLRDLEADTEKVQQVRVDV